jgi:hypothetical protein
LQEKATKKSSPQLSQRTRAKPWARVPHSRYLRKRSFGEAKSLLYISGRGVVVALAVELAGTGQLKPGLEVRGYRAVQQGALGVAEVVGFGGFRGCSRLRA